MYCMIVNPQIENLPTVVGLTLPPPGSVASLHGKCYIIIVSVLWTLIFKTEHYKVHQMLCR